MNDFTFLVGMRGFELYTQTTEYQWFNFNKKWVLGYFGEYYSPKSQFNSDKLNSGFPLLQFQLETLISFNPFLPD